MPTLFAQWIPLAPLPGGTASALAISQSKVYAAIERQGYASDDLGKTWDQAFSFAHSVRFLAVGKNETPFVISYDHPATLYSLDKNTQQWVSVLDTTQTQFSSEKMRYVEAASGVVLAATNLNLYRSANQGKCGHNLIFFWKGQT